MAWYVYVFWFFAIATFLSASVYVHEGKWNNVIGSILACLFWSFLVWYNGGF